MDGKGTVAEMTFQPVRPVVGEVDGEPLGLQAALDPAGQRTFVFDHEDSHGAHSDSEDLKSR